MAIFDFLKENIDVINLVLDFTTVFLAIIAAFQFIRNQKMSNSVEMCSEAGKKMHESVAAIFSYVEAQAEMKDAITVNDLKGIDKAKQKQKNAALIYTQSFKVVSESIFLFASAETLELMLKLKNLVAEMSENGVRAERLIALALLCYTKLRLEVNKDYVPFSKMYRTFNRFPEYERKMLNEYVVLIREFHVKGFCFTRARILWRFMRFFDSLCEKI